MRTAALIVILSLLAAGCGEGSAAPEAAAGGGDGELRILSLTPNITEILFAMGLGDRVVGRSTYCDYPPEARKLPAVGDTLSLDVERIVALRPDLAFLITGREALVNRLRGLGIRTVPLESDTMAELLSTIRTIGREAGRESAAEALVARIEAELAAVRASVAGLDRPRVLFTFPMSVGGLQVMVAGRGTFVDELLRTAGAENAYPDVANWPTISPERIIALAPDVVIVHAEGLDPDGERARAIRAAWSRWDTVPAVARGRVHLLTEPFITIPGPRVGRAAEIVARTVHPELAEGGP